MAAKALTVCPKDLCVKKNWGKGKVRKLISGGAGLIFKGSGFYITDYRSEKYKEAAKKESGVGTGDGKAAKPAAGGEGKPAAGGESKPAPKAESKPAKSSKAGE